MKAWRSMSRSQKVWVISLVALWVIGIPLSLVLNHRFIEGQTLLPSSGKVHIYTWCIWLGMGLYTLLAEWYVNRLPRE